MFTEPHHEEPLSKVEQKEIKKLERRGRRLVGGIALGLCATSAVSAYWNDVEENKEVQATSEITISVKGEALDPNNNNSALLFLHGFGTYDANDLTHYLGPAYQQALDGELWSVVYGNAPLNEEVIAQKAEALALDRGITNVTIVGYSAGGTIGVDVAEHIYTDTDLEVKAIAAVHSPSGYDDLLSYQQSEIEAARLVSKIIPSAEYSTAVRVLGEMYFRRDNYIEKNASLLEHIQELPENVEDFFEAWDESVEAVERPTLPGSWLLTDQILAIANADIGSNLQSISDSSEKANKPLPSVIYTGTANAGMVKDNIASENFCRLSRAAQIPCLILNVPGAIHSRPDKSVQAYNDTLLGAASEINATLDYEKSVYLANRAPDHELNRLSQNAPKVETEEFPTIDASSPN